MYSMGSDWRKRHTMFDPSRFSIENYCTDTKKEMKHSFGDELLNNLHLLPDPLKKNLADSIITTNEKPKQRNKTMLNMESCETVMPKAEAASPRPGMSPLPTLSGITSFFSGVMNVISSAMFLRRSPSPPRYYDCYDESNVSRQGSPVSWHTASAEDQNKNVRAHNLISNSESDLVSDMSKDCHDAAAQCEDKLNRLRLLLKSKPVETPNNCLRRPRKRSVSPPQQKTVVELGSVEKQSPNIQDNLTFATEINGEDLSSVENSPAIQSLDRLSNASVNSQTDEKDYFDEVSGRFHSTSATESEDSFQIVFTDSPQTRPRVPSDCESEDSFIVFEESPDSCYTSNDVFGNESESDYSDSDDDVSDSGCVSVTKLAHPLSRTFGDLTDDSLYEDKPVDEVDCAVRTVCEEIPSEDIKDISEVCDTDNEVKSTGLLLNDAKKALKKNLLPKKVSQRNWWLTAQSLKDIVYLSSFGTAQRDRTKTSSSMSSSENEDSIENVFTDTPKARQRLPSNCDSEDSFIVFEGSDDGCYSSNDVSESESDSDSDENETCVIKLIHTVSQKFKDSNDGKEIDEVDCAVRFGEEIPSGSIKDSEVSETDVNCSGSSLNGARKSLSTKNVHFSPNPPKVHVMRVWAFAARQARAGHWERCAIDRDRFKRRIADVDMAVSWVLKPQHRSRVMFQRFMPWWNAQKRKEIADKKQKDAEDKLRAETEKHEEDKLRAEAEKHEEERLRAEENTTDDTEENAEIINTRGNTVINGENDVAINGIIEKECKKEIDVKDTNLDVQKIGNEIKEQKPLENDLFDSKKKANIKIDSNKSDSGNPKKFKMVAVNGNLDSKLNINGTVSGT